MSKLNRILSLIICFAMVVISLPAVSMVSADANFATSFLIEDNTEYASFADATNWSFPGSEYADVGVDEEGNITYTQKKQTIYVNGSQNQIRTENLVYTLPESVVAEDEANRTKITTNNYTGTVVIELVYDYVANDSAAGLNQKEDGSSSKTISGSYSLLGIGDGTTNAIHSRISNKSVAHTNSSQATFGAQSQFVGTASGTTNGKLVYTINTDDLTVKAEGGGRVAETTFPDTIKYISEFTISNMQRMGVGTKTTIDSLNVTVTPAYTAEATKMLTETLPAKLVDDVNSVTEDINLPTGEGITWESSKPAAISATGEVSKIVGQTQEVTLTATAVVDGVTYKKSYDMTVAAGEEVVLPDKPVTDEVVITDNIDYESFDEAENWSLADDKHVKAEVRDGKIYYEQTAQTLFTSSGKQNTTPTKPLVYTFPAIAVAEDTENNTKITTNNYRGNIDISVTYDQNLIDPVGNKELDPNGIITFNAYYTLSATNEALASNVNTRTFNTYVTNWIGITKFPTNVTLSDLPATGRTLHYSIDTAAKTASVTADGTDLTSEATIPDSLSYISAFQLYGPQRLCLGSNVAIDKLEIKVVPQALTSAELSAINNLVPAKLEGTENALEADIDVPVIDGVTWSTSDADVITADGKITKIKGAEASAQLIATFKVDGITYNKEYTVKVAPADNFASFYVDGELFDTVEVKRGETVTAISAPDKEGMTFLGWFEEGASESFDFNTVIADDVNLYAKYEPTKYKVYFRVDTFVQEDLTMEVPYGEAVGTVPAVPEKQGKTAMGWLIAGSANVFLAEDTIVEDDMYVDAVYGNIDAAEYTVTFKNGDEIFATTKAWEGYTFEFPENPTKENYTFAYWERNGVEFKETDVMLGKDITLNAVFTPNPVEVKFYSDDQTLYLTGTGYYDTAYGELPAAPTVDGKAFKFWELENGERFTADTVITAPVNVYAKWDVPTVIVNEDITKYTSLTDGLIQFKAPDTGYTTASFDNGLKLTLTKWEPLNNKGTANADNVMGLSTHFRALVDSNEEARTKTYMNNLVGEYEVELTFDVQTIRVKEHEGVALNEGYIHYNMGAYAEDGTLSVAPFSGRLRNYEEGGQGLSVHGYDANKNAKQASLTFKKDQLEHKYIVHFNTYTHKATAMAEGNGSPLAGDIVWNSTPKFINGIAVSPMLRMGVGSYYKLKNVKITEYNTDTASEGYKATKGAIDSLPEKLAENPFAVTENITLPQVEGVVWTTSDESVIDLNGNVNRWYDDLDVVLTATAVSAEGYKYSKEYALTVKAFEFEKEAVEISKDTSNWSFANRADQQEAKHTFDGTAIKVEKVTNAEDSASIKENKTYFAYYDLYNAVASDTYSVTSTNVYDGVYDIEVDIENGVTSDVPMNIALGYKNGDSFFSTATLKVSGTKIALTYPDSGETTATSMIYAANAKNAKLKVRIDSDNNMLSAWIDGKLAFRNIPYVSPFPAASSVDMFSTVRIGVDSNNNAGDYIVVKDVSVNKINAQEIGSVASALTAAEAITVNMLTNTPENVSGNLKALPTTQGGYTIKWATDCEQIDIKTGEVFFAETETDAVVTAYITNNSLEYPVTVRKDFKLHLRARANDAEYGEYLINSLGAITNQDYNNIRYDLNLPVNSDIIWTSSDTSIIGTDGKLNKDAAIYAPKQVKLTASAYGSSKEFVLTVAPRTAQTNLYTGLLPATLSLGSYSDLKLSADAVTSFKLTGSDAEGKVNIIDENGNVIVSTVVEDGAFYFDYKGSKYDEHSLAENAVKNIQILTMPELGKLAIWVDGKITDDYVDFRADAGYIAGVEATNGELKVSELKISTDMYGMLQLNVDNLDYFSNVGNGVLNSDVTLPTASITSADVKWESANTAILTNDGKVTAQDTLAYTTLKFNIKDRTNSNVYIEKTFDIVVECDNSKNLANGAYVTVSKLENMTYPKSNVNDNNMDTVYRVVSASTKPSDITFDLGSEKLVNTMLLVEDAGDIRNFTLYASKDNSTWTEVKSGDMADITNRTVKFDTLSARYMKLTIETANASVVDINEIKFYLFATAEELAQLDMSEIKLPSTASKDLTLVTLGTNGTVIKWTSSDEDVISTTGKVTKPAQGTTVTLTATAEGTDITRTFEVYVAAGSSSGPAVIGGGGSGGGGGASSGIGGANTNVSVGTDITKPVYTEEVKDETEASTSTIYSDVKTTDWYAEAVLKLTEKGIVSGDGTGKFNPQDKVTREQFLKMIIEAADIATDNADNTFADVNSDAWYANYVLTAKKLGIVNGISEMEFGIGSPISRQDMAVFIERLINIKNLEVVKYEVEDFADASNVSDYAADAVANMKAIGLIQGYNNMYNPKDNLTRAEAATVIASLLELIKK